MRDDITQLASEVIITLHNLLTEQSSILCKEGGAVLADYMTSLCKGTEYDESLMISDHMDESTQSQYLVEKSCAELYSLMFAKYLMLHNPKENGNDLDAQSYSTDQCISVQVGEMMKYRPARRVLSILSDCRVTDGNIKIHPETHGKTFLYKVANIASDACPLQRESHIQYIAKHLTKSGQARTIPLKHLNCSEPWIIYWALHSLRILGADLSEYRQHAINSLLRCWDPVNGGFGGGADQIGHLATTYAAVCCFKMLDATALLDLRKMRKFLSDMKQEDGSYTVHRGGERDVRGSYCAIATASMLGMLDEELSANVASRIASCQGYDGGISGEPNLESHAGYVYCGVAALHLLGSLDMINKDRLRKWCKMRQTPQLGFQGRPHKLVDSCYSFWIGGTLAILGEESQNSYDLTHKMLQAYILCAAQSPSGGFRDKPGKAVDLYHTCYTLSALEIISGSNEHHTLNFSLNIIY